MSLDYTIQAHLALSQKVQRHDGPIFKEKGYLTPLEERVLLALGSVFILLALGLAVGAPSGCLPHTPSHLYSYAIVAGSIGLATVGYSLFSKVHRRLKEGFRMTPDRWHTVAIAVGIRFILMAIGLTLGATFGFLHHNPLHLYSCAIVAGSIGIAATGYGLLLKLRDRFKEGFRIEARHWHLIAIAVGIVFSLTALVLAVAAASGSIAYNPLHLYSFAILAGSIGIAAAGYGLIFKLRDRFKEGVHIDSRPWYSLALVIAILLTLTAIGLAVGAASGSIPGNPHLLYGYALVAAGMGLAIGLYSGLRLKETREEKDSSHWYTVAFAVGLLFSLLAIGLIAGTASGFLPYEPSYLYSYAIVSSSLGLSLIALGLFPTLQHLKKRLISSRRKKIAFLRPLLRNVVLQPPFGKTFFSSLIHEDGTLRVGLTVGSQVLYTDPLEKEVFQTHTEKLRRDGLHSHDLLRYFPHRLHPEHARYTDLLDDEFMVVNELENATTPLAKLDHRHLQPRSDSQKNFSRLSKMVLESYHFVIRIHGELWYTEKFPKKSVLGDQIQAALVGWQYMPHELMKHFRGNKPEPNPFEEEETNLSWNRFLFSSAQNVFCIQTLKGPVYSDPGILSSTAIFKALNSWGYLPHAIASYFGDHFNKLGLSSKNTSYKTLVDREVMAFLSPKKDRGFFVLRLNETLQCTDWLERQEYWRLYESLQQLQYTLSITSQWDDRLPPQENNSLEIGEYTYCFTGKNVGVIVFRTPTQRVCSRPLLVQKASIYMKELRHLGYHPRMPLGFSEENFEVVQETKDSERWSSIGELQCRSYKRGDTGFRFLVCRFQNKVYCSQLLESNDYQLFRTGLEVLGFEWV